MVNPWSTFMVSPWSLSLVYFHGCQTIALDQPGIQWAPFCYLLHTHAQSSNNKWRCYYEVPMFRLNDEPTRQKLPIAQIYSIMHIDIFLQK